MNLFRCPILKPTAASIDKEALRWSLSWHPEGHCDSFTKGAILLFAPPTSGVYGLFNFDCQVFIGESENIQEALLRHESETDFQSQGLQPTGFTFEPCAAELRKSKADELIARFHPVLQTEAALTETWSASNDPGVSEAGLGGHEETFSHHQEFPLHEPESDQKCDGTSTSSGRMAPCWRRCLSRAFQSSFILACPSILLFKSERMA